MSESTRPFHPPGDAGIVGPIPFGPGQRALIPALVHLARRLTTPGAVASAQICPACVLGSEGAHAQVLRGWHHCPGRWTAMEDVLAEDLAPHDLSDTARLEGHTRDELVALGRLGAPLHRPAGRRRFELRTWSEVETDLEGRLPGRELGVVVDPRVASAEGLLAWRRLAAGLQVPHLALHTAPLRGARHALREGVGSEHGDVGVEELLHADLVLLWGHEPTSAAPDVLRWLHHAKRHGTRVVTLGPRREADLFEAWIPSIPRSAWFGSVLADEPIALRADGATALVGAVLRRLDADGRALGLPELPHLAAWVATLDVRDLERQAGTRDVDLDRLARALASARSVVSVVGDGIARADPRAATAIVALHAGLRQLGREGAGVLVLVGPPGASAALDLESGDDACRNAWGTPGPPARPLVQQTLVCLGDASGLDPNLIAAAPLRIHAIQHVDPACVAGDGEVWLLPVQAPAEQADGYVLASSDGRVRYAERSVDPPGSARSAAALASLVGTAARPELAGLFGPVDGARLRADLAAVTGWDVASLHSERADFPWRLVREPARAADVVPQTPRAGPPLLAVPAVSVPPGWVQVATRDAGGLGVDEGDVLRVTVGATAAQLRVCLVDALPGSLFVHPDDLALSAAASATTEPA